MNKYLIIIISILLGISACKDDCDHEPDTSCSGMYEFRDGKCQCPENSVDMGRSFCKPFSKNNFWIQEGDPCLGQEYLFFGESSTDLFDESQSTIHLGWSQGPEAARVRGYVKIDKIDNKYYLVNNPYNDIDTTTNDFRECVGTEYQAYDMEIKIDLDWTIAHVTYKFWNDIDTSIHVKKEFGPELKAVFKSNTGPTER